MNATTKNSETFQVSTPSDNEITITRFFDAACHLVFEALTKPELVRRWLLGPDGWSMPVCEIDLRIGGTYRFVWRHDKKGNEMTVRGAYREIVIAERLVHTEKFDDAWYDGECLVTYGFVARAGKTVLSLTMRYDSKEIRDKILKSGMERGVAVSYDRLEEMLAKG